MCLGLNCILLLQRKRSNYKKLIHKSSGKVNNNPDVVMTHIFCNADVLKLDTKIM